MGLKVLVVDDEPLARDGLTLLLVQHSGIESVSEARNGREAIAAIRDSKPDLVLLDVQMPRVDGFAVVHAIGADRMPAVIFVTAHDQYAIRAFEISAVDYLLKPVTEERFALAFTRAAGRLRGASHEEGTRQVLAMLDAMAKPPRPLERFAVRSGERTILDQRGRCGLDRGAPELRPPARGPGGACAPRADEHHRRCARSRPLPADPPVAHRERATDRAALVSGPRPMRRRAQVGIAPPVRAHVRRSDPPRAVQSVLIDAGAEAPAYAALLRRHHFTSIERLDGPGVVRIDLSKRLGLIL